MNKYLEKIAVDLKETTDPKDIGIDLSKGEEKELYKWMMAVTLFSRPIQRSVAARAAQQLTSEGLHSPEAVERAGYSELVQALGRGHYVRYDFSMSDTLLSQAAHLKAKYGTLKNLIDNRTPEQIREEIQSFKGIGPLGSQLFVEGVKPHLDKYKNTDPSPALIPVDVKAARLREILVNSSRKGLFNPYSKDQYDWTKTKEETDDKGNLIKFHVYDKRANKYAELHHPEVQKYTLKSAYE